MLPFASPAASVALPLPRLARNSPTQSGSSSSAAAWNAEVTLNRLRAACLVVPSTVWRETSSRVRSVNGPCVGTDSMLDLGLILMVLGVLSPSRPLDRRMVLVIVGALRWVAGSARDLVGVHRHYS